MSRTFAPNPDRIIEASLLAALVTVPLFFNVHSYRSFEPDKAVLLRLLALAMVLGWAAKAAGPGAASAARLVGRADRLTVILVGCALAVFFDLALATAWSIDPRVSLQGSYHRLQGLYTAAAYLVLFLSVATVVRTRVQAARTIDAMLLASFAVALYGLMQHLGLDPIAWEARRGSPVRSTLGNSLLTSGFLVVAVPLALARLAGALGTLGAGHGALTRSALVAGAGLTFLVLLIGWAAHPVLSVVAWLASIGLWAALGALSGRPRRESLRVVLYAGLLAAQIACVVLTLRRGPFLALVCGLAAFVLLHTLAGGQWKRHLAAIALTVLAGVALVAVNVLGRAHSAPDSGAERLVSVQPGSGSGQVRLLIWEAAAELLAADPLRAAIGYGPETLRLALAPHYRPELAALERPGAVPDRAHNATFETLVTTGVVGLVLHCALVLAVLCAGLRALGVLPTTRHAVAACGSAVAGALLLTLGAGLADGSFRLLGLAIPFGLLAGLLAYAGLYSARRLRAPAPTPAHERSRDGLTTAALCSAVVVHFVEIQFGIATVASQSYFWALAGLVVASTGAGRPAASRALELSGHGRAGGGEPLLPRCLLAALVIATLVFDFSGPGADVMSERRLFWLFALVAGLHGLFLTVEQDTGAATPSSVVLAAYATTFVVTMAGGYWLFAAPDRLALPALSPLTFVGAVGALVALLALARRDRSRSPRLRPARLALLGLVLLPAGFLAGWSNLELIEADIWFKRGWQLEQQCRYRRAMAAYRRAIDLAPDEAHYRTSLAKASVELASRASGAPERARLFAEAHAALLEALRVDPLDASHPANLARLNVAWAAVGRPEVRAQRLEQASDYYRRAVRLAPTRPELWREWAETHRSLGQPVQAREKRERARALAAGIEQRERGAGGCGEDGAPSPRGVPGAEPER